MCTTVLVAVVVVEVVAVAAVVVVVVVVVILIVLFTMRIVEAYNKHFYIVHEFCQVCRLTNADS